MRKLFWFAAVLLLIAAGVRADQAFTTVDQDWHDAKRNVDVPVKLKETRKVVWPARREAIQDGPARPKSRCPGSLRRARRRPGQAPSASSRSSIRSA